MNNFDRIGESVVGKRRKLSKSNNLREDIKKMRHSGGGKMPAVGCSHTPASNFCHADTLTPGDLLKNFQLFYSKSTKPEQDQAILQMITVKKVKRRRVKIDNSDMQKNREVTSEYHLLTEDHSTKVPVCKATFCSVLGEFIFYLLYYSYRTASSRRVHY